jgi:hypothetical protein
MKAAHERSERRAIISHYMPLDFEYIGPASDRPPYHIVRGMRAGQTVREHF